LNQIQAQIDKDGKIDFEKYDDPHIPAVLIKRFFRDLTPRLLPEESQFALNGITEKSKRIEFLKQACGSLPPLQFNTLKFLIKLLFKLSKVPELKMDAQNLSLMLSPNLFPVHFSNTLKSSEVEKRNAVDKALIVEFFVTYYPEIFKDQPLLESETNSTNNNNNKEEQMKTNETQTNGTQQLPNQIEQTQQNQTQQTQQTNSQPNQDQSTT